MRISSGFWKNLDIWKYFFLGGTVLSKHNFSRISIFWMYSYIFEVLFIFFQIFVLYFFISFYFVSCVLCVYCVPFYFWKVLKYLLWFVLFFDMWCFACVGFSFFSFFPFFFFLFLLLVALLLESPVILINFLHLSCILYKSCISVVHFHPKVV